MRVDAAAAKLRRRRVVPLEPAAVATLSRAKVRGAALPIPRSTRIKQQRTLRRALAWRAWPQDVLRHSAATYLLGLHRDAGRVAMSLANSVDVLMKHYYEVVTPEETAEFWVPPTFFQKTC
ncbi:MAG: hypothetical protein LDL56_01715 [Armatimonadetes bacterium]|nr:hypothetical protein [Armatimonadota bacterium]